MADLVGRLRFDATRCEMQFSKGVAGNIEDAADEIERLRTTLATVRLFIEDEMIAHAVVALEGADARDPNNPSLLQLIDAALGDEQQGDGK